MAILKKINFGNGAHDIAKTIVTAKSNGVMSVAAPDGVSNGKDEQKDYQYELDVNVDDSTIKKSEGKLTVGNVPAAQVSVVDEGGKLTATNVEAALAELDNKITSTGNVAKKYKVVSVDSPAGTSLAEYKLQVAEGTSETYADVIGSANIVVPKDQHLRHVELVNQRPADTEHGETDPVSGNFLKFTYVLNNGTESDVYVDVSAFLSESEFGDGLEVSNAGVVSVKLGQGLEFGGETGEGVKQSIKVKIDSTSEKDSQSTPVDFLTVGANGVKIQGIGAEIDRKIAALDVPDTADEGKYVSAVSETDGKVSVSRANVSDAVLNGYAKGTDATAILATDSLKVALGKLENQVDKAKAAATTKVVEGTDEGNNLEIASAKETDGSTTYTINLTDVASKAALDAEITARKAVDGQSGDTYAANGGTNYISGAKSLNDADVKLDTALKAEAERANSAEGEIASKVGLTGVEGARTFTPTTNYGGAGTESAATSVMDNMQKLDTKLKEVADGLAAVQYQVSDTTLVFFGISPKTV